MIPVSKSSNGGRSALFFTEMTIALLFFSISGAVIIRVFAAADKKSRESSARESAVLFAQSAAEAYSVGNGAEEALTLAFGAAPEADGGEYFMSFDEEFSPAEGGEILLSAKETSQEIGGGTLLRMTLDFTMNGEPLYSVECSAYCSGGDQ